MHLGVDPGLDGGLALLNGPEIQLHIMPTTGTKKRSIDEAALRSLLEGMQLYARQESQLLVAYVESVAAMPKQGVASTFNFGCGYGLLRGVLCGLCIPYRLVKPLEWQRRVTSVLTLSFKVME